MNVKNTLEDAVATLKKGGLVAMPTETVYGLAADAKNPDAIQKIFQAKGRPADHPVIVHIGHIDQLSDWAQDVSSAALHLAEAFWPGPLTLILKKAPHVSDLITGGQDTIGIRVPNHPIALSLLRAFASGVAAPSANRFGRVSPTTVEAVTEELGDVIDCILDGGQCEVGVESTIVDVSGDHIRILRPGVIGAKQIEEVLHRAISYENKNVPRVSGALESHYAPATLVKLMDKETIKNWLSCVTAKELPTVILAREIFKNVSGIVFHLMPKDALSYAHDLYQTLRELDKKNYKQIIIESVPLDPGWDAVRDRLQRAAS